MTLKLFNDLADFSGQEVEALLTLARRLQTHPEPRALAGKVLALLFLSPSLRTLSSFQASMVRLGGGSFVISPEMSIHGLESRSGIVMDGVAAEHLREAIPVISSYGDALGIRAFANRTNLATDLADTEFLAMRALATVPLINMESAIQHPCQSLADWKTLDELGMPKNGGKFVLSWSWHPKALPLAVPSATLHMAAMRGMDVTVVHPEGFALPPEITNKARRAASLSGGSVRETNDRTEAYAGAHVIYAKEWSSTLHYGDRVADQKLREQLQDWIIDEASFSRAQPSARFMHCLPVRRGVAVTDRVLDGPRSVVVQEAQNRMWGQMAVVYQMMGPGI